MFNRSHLSLGLVALVLIANTVPYRAATAVPVNGQELPTKENVFLKVMPLGDSITFGLFDPKYGAYRHLLGTLLEKDGFKFDFVGSLKSGDGIIPDPDNEGHSGWTINQIKHGIDTKGWLETYEPDLILLHIGTNDLRLHMAAAAPDNLSLLLDDILERLPRAHVIVARIIPARWGPVPGYEAYVAAIPGIVASKGPRVSMVNMENILTSSDYRDALHPNHDGYDKMARAWEPAIRAVLRAKRTTFQ